MKQINVLYDYSAFTYQKIGGVSKSFCELISRLPHDIHVELALLQSDNIHLRDSKILVNVNHEKLNLDSFFFHYKFKGKYNLYHWLSENLPFFHSVDRINKRLSIKKLIEGKFDVFHPTGFSTYFLPYLNGKPYIYTVHDMTCDLFPVSKGMMRQALNIKLLAQNAAHVIAVSYNTKEDLMRLTKIPDQKITVIHHGAPNIERITGKRIIASPYFLYVGARHSYKNFASVLDCMQVFVKTHPEVKLVCTGANFSRVEIKLIDKYRLHDSLIHYFANDTQLKNLYANAIAFVYPSLYEGFGMPILESFSYGCPVLLNKKSCFPEIGGNAAIYFNSDSYGSNMYEAFEKVYSFSEQERNTQVEKGYNRLNLFSWKRSAEQLAQVYRNIANR